VRIVFIFFLSFLTFSLPAQELSFSTFDERQGITQPYIYNIGQNKDGFLCFTTSEGAYKFDGLNFKRMEQKGSIKEPFFKSMLLLADNVTFLGTNTGGVIKIKNNKVVWKYVSEERTAPVNFLKEYKGKIYAFYQDGSILELSPDGKKKFYKLEIGYLYSSFAFFEGKFIAGRDIGITIFTLDNGRLTVTKEINVNDDAVESIYIHKKDIYLGTGSSGLYNYKGGKLSKVELGSEELNQSNIKAIHHDGLSSIWISAYGLGVFEIKRNSENGAHYVRNSITEGKGLPSAYINSIFIDRESNLWLGSLGKGICKLNSNSLIHYNLTSFNLGKSVYSVYSGPQQMFGMTGGIILVDGETDEITPWEGNSQLPNDIITAIEYHASGIYYIGTKNSGLFRYNMGTKRLTAIDMSVDLLSKTINNINVIGSVVYVSTMNGLYRVNVSDDQSVQFSSKDGLPNNVVYSTFLKSDGKLLLGTLAKGIYYLQGNEIRKLNIQNPYGLLDIYSFQEDRRGELWFATNGQGVFHLTDRDFNRVSSNTGLYSDFIYQIIIDKKNTVWCGHRGGLSRVNDQERVLDKFDYMDNISMDFNLNASGVDNQNNVWFGTNEGVLKFSILQDKFNVFLAKPVLIAANVNDVDVENPQNLNLSYLNKKIKFTFQTVSLTFPEDVLYQYRLMGSDEGWSKESKENSAVLGQLLDGDYKLEVRSKVGNGEWSKPVVISEIHVQPPFWKRWYVIMFGIIGIIAFTFLISYYRTRSLSNQKMVLEEKLAIRTKEIESKNAKITQQFEEMQESIDYGVRIQNSLLPSASALTRLIPDSFLFFQPKDKVSGDFYYFDKFKDHLIVSVADATGHGVPGAFISLIGFVSLKEIIHRHEIHNPAMALSELDMEINNTLGQYNRESDGKDGMDMAICDINLETREVIMSSALRPIWIFRDGEFEKIRSSKFSVGGGMNSSDQNKKDYDLEKRKLKKGDTIYLFTDGYVDQFGSERDKKLMSKRLLYLIKENYHLPMKEQGRIISKYLNDWKGSRDQTDDILVIGLRL
jgi:ligand-binding sensor domain-containing protein/serine phosphatase RsbU (regulator of sigma subunit)